MFKCGLLLIYSPVAKIPSRIGYFLNEAKSLVSQVLYVRVERSLIDDTNGSTWQKQIEDDHLYLPSIYRAASSRAPNLDVRVIIKSQLSSLRHKPQILLCNHPLDHRSNKALPSLLTNNLNINQFQEIKLIPEPTENLLSASLLALDKRVQPITKHDHVCLGGTFDNLHNGHKVLLSEALIRTRKSMTIGVTESSMTRKKILWELIKPIEERIADVRDHLTDVADNIEFKIVGITDPFGPAITDPSLSCIVVSEETLKGGEKINQIRLEKGMSKLEIVCFDLIKDTVHESEYEEEKISSSSLRMRKLGTLLRPPSPKPNIPPKPYRIGLTGGICSGKSSICKKLSELGAGVINADLLAHETYNNSSAIAYAKLIETFGHDIINPADGSINRQKLGSIVFSDKSKLSKLNSIIWPATKELIEKRIRELGMKHDIVVVEAALIIEAGWEDQFHQLWVSIISEEEAIKRLKSRNNLDEEEARKRIANQMTNINRVKKANIVFSSQWDEKFTRQQVEKAYKLLRQEFVKN